MSPIYRYDPQDPNGARNVASDLIWAGVVIVILIIVWNVLRAQGIV